MKLADQPAFPIGGYTRFRDIPLRERFEAGYTPVSESGCWLWNGFVQKNGYCKIRSEGRTEYVHRVSWFLHFGPIPESMSVCHKCDVRICVNPKHLFLGTLQDNMDDMCRKNRQARTRGELSGKARFTEQDIRNIRDSKDTYSVLAKKYGTGIEYIYKIRKGLVWRHL